MRKPPIITVSEVIMPYVDKTYYDNTYIGAAVDTTDFPRYEKRAEDVINQLTRNRILHAGVSAFSDAMQECIKNAVCAQIEHYVYNGIDAANSGISAESFTVGKVSVSGSKNAGKQSMVSPQAIAFLEQTGLMSNAADVIRRW